MIKPYKKDDAADGALFQAPKDDRFAACGYTPTKEDSGWYVLLIVCGLGLVLLAGCKEGVHGTSDWQGPPSAGAELVPQARGILKAALEEQDPVSRVNAIEVVAATRQIRMMPAVEGMLRDNAVPVRFAACLAVGDVQYSLAEKQVAPLLNDMNQNVRIAAAYAMYRLGQTGTYDIVLKAVASPDQTLRANAAMLLGKAKDKTALKYLWWTLGREDSDFKVRFQAAESIAMLGDERIFPKLWATVLSAYADDRIMGIRGMGALATAKAKEVLITKLDDDALDVRLAAAEQLGILGDNTGEPEVHDVFTKNLTAGLRGPELERTRTLAAMAIGRIASPRLTAMLPQLLKDPSPAVRIAAAKAVLLIAAKGHDYGKLGT
ncbi:MAG TPA: HEAT repeat domain-containing protein [Sedimentisphaerales bacterium]|nr:HEAT repeat domain-containing protein [Sedimentisphaerales bacterium]